MRLWTATCATKKTNKPCSFSARLPVVPPSGMFIRLFHSAKKQSFQSLSLNYRLCPVIFGSDRQHCRSCLVLYYLCRLPSIATNWRNNPVPLPPPGETLLSLGSFLVPKLARAYRTLLCCLVCWCGWTAGVGRELVRWTVCVRIGNTCG